MLGCVSSKRCAVATSGGKARLWSQVIPRSCIRELMLGANDLRATNLHQLPRRLDGSTLAEASEAGITASIIDGTGGCLTVADGKDFENGNIHTDKILLADSTCVV